MNVWHQIFQVLQKNSWHFSKKYQTLTPVLKKVSQLDTFLNRKYELFALPVWNCAKVSHFKPWPCIPLLEILLKDCNHLVQFQKFYTEKLRNGKEKSIKNEFFSMNWKDKKWKTSKRVQDSKATGYRFKSIWKFIISTLKYILWLRKIYENNCYSWTNLVCFRMLFNLLLAIKMQKVWPNCYHKNRVLFASQDTFLNE